VEPHVLDLCGPHVKAIPIYRPGQTLRVPEDEAPRVQENWHMKVVRFFALRTGCLYSPPPRKYSWYSFLLEAESTTGPQSGRKDYVNEKFQ